MTDLIKQYVDKGRFTDLFVEELGWDRPKGTPRTVDAETDNGAVTLTEAATYKGITVWTCPTLPDGRAQRLIDREVRKASLERLTIFHDGTRQEWRWPQTKDAQGAGSTRLVLHDHIVGRDNPALAQRLAQIEIGLDEDGVSVVEVARRLKKAFDADKVTKKFYKRFKSQHDDLCDAIEGIPADDRDSATSEIRWYGSLLMNRIMFIYFMQKKGFLDNDRDYLRNRLDRIRQTERSDAPGTFYDFYKHFLLPLFHHGLGHPDTAGAIDDPVIADLVGDIPYVNGGIFAVHPIEAANDIAIDDHVFEALFGFLDGWQWHLDDRPTGDPNEINPDVLGYIFEQFINNKQQGAYYTKEDVTGYMTDNTLIPVFLDRLADATGINPWQHLTKQPDRYIWDSVTHGDNSDLPDHIVAEQDQWPRPTWDDTDPDPGLALPGEPWWEVARRREHAADLRQQLASGDINTSDAAITANIDLETLAVDVIDSIDSAADVVAAWRVLTAMKVIDPTCGSGAFLFAALTVLQTLYGAVLDAARLHTKTSPNNELADIVTEAAKHSSADYYLLKHAALNNIYGVDLMPEAVEVARLRLFLKLISQVHDRDDIEPLPDLEFNIRPGNILVGAVDEDSIRDLADLTTLPLVDDMVDQAAEAAAVYRAFSDAQTRGDTSLAAERRVMLREVTSKVTDTLDEWWYSRDQSQSGMSNLDRYLDVHRPFHWPIEFPEVFAAGGFDVIIGNPPYVSPRKVPYYYAGFETDTAPDIYAPCIERAIQIKSADGRLAMITPLSLSFSEDFAVLRRLLDNRFAALWSSTYGKRPSSIFAGVQVRCTIVLAGGERSRDGHASCHTSRHNIFPAARRSTLLNTVEYVRLPASLASERWFKVDNEALVAVIEALKSEKSIAHLERRNGKHEMWWKPVAAYWFPIAFDPAPTYLSDGSLDPKPNLNSVAMADELDRDLCVVGIAGKLGYLWWSAVGDDLNVPKWVVQQYPAFHLNHPALRDSLASLTAALRERLETEMIWNKNAGKWVGNVDLSECTDITDESDRLILDSLGLDWAWPAVETWYRQAMKAGGEATGSHRGPNPPLDV